MDQEIYLRRTTAQVRVEAAKRNLTLTTLAQHMGFSRGHVSVVLQARTPMKVKFLFAALAVFDEPPALFFAKIFGKQRPAGELGVVTPWFGDPSKMRLAKPRAVEAELADLHNLLRIKIKSSSTVTMRELSRLIGKKKDYASQIFRGNVDLRLRHLLAFLDYLGEEPYTFFAELYGVLPDRGYDPRSRPLD